MREGLRSSTVSQRPSDVSRRKRERSDSKRGVKEVSDVGLAGDCDRVRNILPDLNAEANPSEFDSDWPCEGGYVGDGSEKGTLVENGVEGFAADESIKSKGVDAEGNGEVGKDSVHSCLEKIEQSEQEVDGELRSLVTKTVDLNVEALDCDDLPCDNLRAGEETVLVKDEVGAVDGILQKNLGCEADNAACSEHHGLTESKMEIASADWNTGDDRSELQSRPVVLGCCSEDRPDPISQTRNLPEKDKLLVDGKVLRSMVVGSNCSSENTTCTTCSNESIWDRLEAVHGMPDTPEKDKLLVGGKVLRSRVVGSTCSSENTTCSNESIWDRLEAVHGMTDIPDKDKLQVDGKVLRSRVVGSNCSSENTTCSNESIWDRLEAVHGMTDIPDKDKLQVGGKVLRSRVVGSNCSSENITCSIESIWDRLEAVNGKTDVPEKDKLQVDGKVLRSRVIVAVTTEGQASGSGKRKRATGDKINETEVTGNDESNENLDGQNKKHEIIPGITIEEEDILEKLPHGEEAFAEELKIDESNKFFDGQNKRDNECWELSRKKDESTDPLSSMIDKDEAAGEVLNNGISKELAVDASKCKVKRGRGRPRKQYVDNVSIDPLLKNIEDSLEDGVKMKQEENNKLTDHKDKKRKRGRPRKIDKDIDGKKLSQRDLEGSDKVGKRMKKAAAINKWNKFGNGSLNKPKRGRPKKIDKENGAQEPIPQDQEGIDKGVVVMRKEDTHQFVEGSVRQVRKQIVEGTQAEVKSNASCTASPLSSSRLKRKRENTEEEPLKYESNLKVKSSSKCNLKVKTSSTREEKNMVRQQIVDMLKSAGWTVEYKPRQGREYVDSVYRCPEGRTHWSVTLAYRVLKQQVETGKAANFCFTPIPDEKLSTLFRVTMKERSDKNKQKQKPSVKSSGKCKARKKGDYKSGGEENIAASLFKKKSSAARSGKHNRRRCALLVRGSGHGSNSAAEEFMSVSGKHSILSWMIRCGVIPPGGKVHCRRRTKVLKEGNITKDGIHCSCCSKLHSVAQFEAHAGLKSCPVYENLYLDNGSSLLQCQMESWSKQEESIRLGFHEVNVDDDDPNDDTCGICGDGGNLICCDGCPSTFHQACLNILKFPSGDWYCVYCSCKYCGAAGGGEDQDNGKHDKIPSLLTCCLCDGKYHRLCAYEKDCEYDQSSGSAFCGKSCEKIYERFQLLVGVKAEVGDGYTCTLIKPPDSTPGSGALEPKEIENSSKLAVALSVMDECFLPIIDHRSGINLMRHTLYSCGSNFKRLNFRGFCTAILEKEDELIAVASIRIHGKELAEMPFIGTRNAYRRRGMCRRLLSGIELALRSLAIEKLVIPAVSEVVETWTSAFGFEPLGGLGSEMKHMNIIVFPGVDMLQKPLLNGDTTSDQEEKNNKSDDPCSKEHAEENGLIEIKAGDGCLSEKLSENVSLVPLDSASVDQEEGSKSGRAHSDTLHSTEENNPSIPAKDENCPVGTSDLVVLPSEELVLEAKSSLAERGAYEGIEEIPKSVNCPKPEFDLINPLENGVADPSSNSLCNHDLPTCSINYDNNNPVGEINDSTCPVITDGSLLLVTDHSVPNGARVNAKTPEDFKPDLQIDCKIVTQFNLEKSCNMDSSSNDLGTPVKFHACSAPEVGSK